MPAFLVVARVVGTDRKGGRPGGTRHRARSAGRRKRDREGGAVSTSGDLTGPSKGRPPQAGVYLDEMLIANIRIFFNRAYVGPAAFPFQLLFLPIGTL